MRNDCSPVLGAEKGTSPKRKINKRKESHLRAKTPTKEVSFSASMTVEASLVLPLFIFFFVNIMTLFNIVKVQCDLEAALHQTGNELTIRAFDFRFGEDIVAETGEEGTVVDAIAGAAGVVYASGKVREYLGPGIDQSCVTDGGNGISFWRSRVLLGNDLVDLVADYKVHPLVPVIGFQDFEVESRYYGHAWTGYDLAGGFASDELQEEMVFVTENGEVYHRDINCKHLHLSTGSVAFNQIPSLRNNDGSKYYACEYCGEGIGGGSVFITNYGNRYHSTVNCTALKRKIYTIPLSEVGGRGPCSSCGY
jgi:hypothetical protein